MVEERMERRLSAILAADIAGYSALMGADEARTVRDLKGHQAVVLPMVAEFSGRIIDIAGDGNLAEPGGICISGKVFEEVNERIELACEDIGEQQLKNIARPVHAYRVRVN